MHVALASVQRGPPECAYHCHYARIVRKRSATSALSIRTMRGSLVGWRILVGHPLADRLVDVCGRWLIVHRDKTNARWFALPTLRLSHRLPRRGRRTRPLQLRQQFLWRPLLFLAHSPEVAAGRQVERAVGCYGRAVGWRAEEDPVQ